jgi:hypothetical protein
MLNFEVQTTLAKLLARENVTVEHGNFSTAFFNVNTRVLGLPLWKDRGKDVYDLLVGHEVGHALFTPPEDWIDSVEELGLPHAYVNVVEDVRIEKLIQKQYPGLVSSFKRGYAVLNKEDFFGLSKYDSVDSLGLIDRINLKAKLRDLIDIKFSAQEQPLVDQTMAVETWEDVLCACQALYAYMKEQKQNERKTKSEEKNDASEDIGQSMSSDIPGSDPSPSNDNDGSGDETTGQTRGSDSSDEPEIEKGSEAPVEASGKTDDIDTVVTDDAFQSRQKDLVMRDARGKQPVYLRAITRRQMKEIVVDYKTTIARREIHKAEFKDKRDWTAENNEFALFKDDTKKYVNIMAKEFEMRKAAYRTLRAQSARSGSIDVNKLHNYKFSDDIFARVTNLADAKSHGMVMFIDFSGSMHKMLKDTIKQALSLVSFCKKVNIPYELYSFTNTSENPEHVVNPGEIHHSNTVIVNLLSSKMSKAEFELSYHHLFMMGAECYSNKYWNKYETMSGTPLNETIMASRFIIQDFKKHNGIQKVHAIFLTDGQSNRLYYKNNGDLETHGYAIDVDGRIILSDSTYTLTDQLIADLGKSCGVIGFFLAERSYDFNGEVWAASSKYVTNEIMRGYRKEYNKNKFISIKNGRGYDEYFIIKGDSKSLNTDADDFEVSENANKTDIARAFKKFASSKKANRLLATQFAKLVA